MRTESISKQLTRRQTKPNKWTTYIYTASDYPFGILPIVFHVLRHTASDYPFDILVIKPYVEGHEIQWPRYQRGNQKPYVEGHEIQWPRYQRGNQKPYVEVLRHTASDYPFDIFWPLYRLSFFDLCLLITPLEGLIRSKKDDTMAKRYQIGNQ
jgi:hypothetical protein